MTNIFIIHGAYDNPGKNWFPWLKNELEKLECKVFIPKFPTPENQTLENWIDAFEDYRQHLDKNSIVIGHSLGSAFLLNLLENLEHPIKVSFFVAGFASLLDIPKFDNINKTFIDKRFDWQKIKQNCSRFFIFHSDNDKTVSSEKTEALAKNLDAKIILVKNAGHFNEKTGYTKFDLLLEKIRNEL